MATPASGNHRHPRGTQTMLTSLPPAVIEADRIHHEILEAVSFSRHLNPTNADEARRAFLRGAEAPPFTYVPLPNPDALLRTLEHARPQGDHPAGALVTRCMDGTAMLIRALRDRTAAAFDALARAADWYPDTSLLAIRFPDARDAEPLDVTSQELVQHLKISLEARALNDWVVELDTVMSARVLVDGAKRTIRVNPNSRFRNRDLDRLVVHEIDVHALRAANGMKQVLRCFQTGLPGSLATEEGLAMVSETRAGVASPGVLARQVDVVRAIERARHMGFKDLYETLEAELGAGLAWGISLRIKRGLARPDLPGVYAKDSVYLRGYLLVQDWLEAGGRPEHLYVGKVSVHDPVKRWLDQGWLQPGQLPPSWTTA